MSYYLCPSRFDLVCEAALLCAHMENDDEEDLRSPSSSLKIGFDVARMAGFKLGMAVRDVNKDAKQEAEEIKMLMSMEWSVRVSKLAQRNLRTNQKDDNLKITRLFGNARKRFRDSIKIQ